MNHERSLKAEAVIRERELPQGEGLKVGREVRPHGVTPGPRRWRHVLTLYFNTEVKLFASTRFVGEERLRAVGRRAFCPPGDPGLLRAPRHSLHPRFCGLMVIPIFSGLTEHPFSSLALIN